MTQGKGSDHGRAPSTPAAGLHLVRPKPWAAPGAVRTWKCQFAHALCTLGIALAVNGGGQVVR